MIAFHMAEDMSFGNWEDFTPEKIKSFSEAKLQYAIQLNQGGFRGAWAMAELARRRDDRIASLINSLQDATRDVQSEVVGLRESSGKLEDPTKTLIGETGKVNREVGLLADSSTRMENLTVKLKRFTVLLII